MPNLNSINFSLSSVFYLIPLYFLIIAPLLRQFFPSDPGLSAPRDIRDAAYFDNGGKGGDLEEEEDTSLQLNPELLSLEDGETIVCELGSDMYRTHIFSYNPLVVYIEGFLSGQEADHLINVSLPNYTPSPVYSSSQANASDPTKRLSDRALLPRDSVVRCIESRARAFQGWKPYLYIERMWAQRYNVSGHYTHHYDWAGTAKGRGGDRLSTFMVYLKAECKGGGTNFPRLRRPRDKRWCEFVDCEQEEGREGVTFKPIKGNAVFWENLRADGSGYPETWHAAFPVEQGEKVGLNIWSWYQPPTGRW
ncbi:hypothetical protein BJX68DRAFT_225648 [Aspergillus pseudodeflectus]|uniref:Prolyl 4-hydroxylase alpha subunit domain-containing protein n=1 Tax=Aspergillus pseudodeflectus TaxID=176178 RepID=A0ABR4LAQ9_9EURO